MVSTSVINKKFKREREKRGWVGGCVCVCGGGGGGGLGVEGVVRKSNLPYHGMPEQPLQVN